jgi:hypothetical protein
MTPETALREVAARFQYRTDRAQYDRREKWRIMRAPSGPLIGDCEDFALTVLWYCCDKSILKFWWRIISFQAAIWHCTTAAGTGHAALWHRGKWVDNIYPAWAASPRHRRWFPWLAPLVAIRLLI